MNVQTAERERVLVIKRVLRARRERAWRAWADAAELCRWWGPKGVSCPTCVWDARPGGAIRITMRAGASLGALEGQEWPMDGTVREVRPEEYLAFTTRALQNGRPILETLVTVRFEDAGENTKLTLAIEVLLAKPEAAGPLSGMETGWTESVGKLGELLARET